MAKSAKFRKLRTDESDAKLTGTMFVQRIRTEHTRLHQGTSGPSSRVRQCPRLAAKSTRKRENEDPLVSSVIFFGTLVHSSAKMMASLAGVFYLKERLRQPVYKI